MYSLAKCLRRRSLNLITQKFMNKVVHLHIVNIIEFNCWCKIRFNLLHIHQKLYPATQQAPHLTTQTLQSPQRSRSIIVPKSHFKICSAKRSYVNPNTAPGTSSGWCPHFIEVVCEEDKLSEFPS